MSKQSALRRLLRQGLKESPVVEDCRRIRLVGGRQLVEGLRPFLVSQTAVADA